MSKTNNKKAVSILEEMSKDSGGGFEEVTSSDVQIPFVRVIQAMSPQIKKSDSAFIKGASLVFSTKDCSHSTMLSIPTGKSEGSGGNNPSSNFME